jgi:hypothetical protein
MEAEESVLRTSQQFVFAAFFTNFDPKLFCRRLDPLPRGISLVL